MNQLQRIATLGEGSQFSEFSVLTRENKSASIYSLEDSVLLRLHGDDFLSLLYQLPSLPKELLLQLAERIHFMQKEQFHIHYYKQEDIVINPVVTQILNPKVWSKFNILPLKFENRGLFVATKTIQNDEFYSFIKSSQPQLQIYVSLINEIDYKNLELNLIESYKKVSLSQNKSSVQNIKALEGSVVEWLQSHLFFKDLPSDWHKQITDQCQIETFEAGNNIFKQESSNEKFYLLASGQVELHRQLKNSNASLLSTTLNPGDVFSEVEILINRPETLSARAKTQVKVLSFPKDLILYLLEAPQFSVPYTQHLARKIQELTRTTSFKFFDPSEGVQIEELSGLIPINIMTEHQVLPLKMRDNELILGVTNPENTAVYSILQRYLSQRRVKIELIALKDFHNWMSKYKNSGLKKIVTPQASSKKMQHLDAVTLLNELVKYGFHCGASDIHFEPNADSYIVRYRVDGVLQEGQEKYRRETGEEVVNRIKVLSQMDTTQRFIPLDGQLKLKDGETTLVARVSTLPTKQGEKVVMRLIKEKSSVPQLSMITPDRRVLSLLMNVVNSTQGVFLVTGPTGSGKSTTLYSIIQELNKVDVCIVSLEDPVEMEIPGTTQVEINEKVNMTFSAALRSALRQDPDVIVLGEIRDQESAKIAFHAAATGHLVISTLHTNDSLGVIPRLRELGISNGILASTLIGASAQRLIRQVCKDCKQAVPIKENEKMIFKSEIPKYKVPDQLFIGRGCSKCHQSGYSGRMPMIEIWQKNKMFESLILDNSPLEQISQQLESQGFETLKEIAFKMAAMGYTTLDEVYRTVGGSPEESLQLKVA